MRFSCFLFLRFVLFGGFCGFEFWKLIELYWCCLHQKSYIMCSRCGGEDIGESARNTKVRWQSITMPKMEFLQLIQLFQVHRYLVHKLHAQLTTPDPEMLLSVYCLFQVWFLCAYAILNLWMKMRVNIQLKTERISLKCKQKFFFNSTNL